MHAVATIQFLLDCINHPIGTVTRFTAKAWWAVMGITVIVFDGDIVPS